MHKFSTMILVTWIQICIWEYIMTRRSHAVIQMSHNSSISSNVSQCISKGKRFVAETMWRNVTFSLNKNSQQWRTEKGHLQKPMADIILNKGKNECFLPTISKHVDSHHLSYAFTIGFHKYNMAGKMSDRNPQREK